MKHCDFCNHAVLDEDDIFFSEWSTIKGVGVNLELVDPDGNVGMGYAPDWLACPVCSAFILDDDWESLIKHVVNIESPNDAIYEMMLRVVYSKAFNLPELLPDAIRL
jgi:hypothetical protein